MIAAAALVLAASAPAAPVTKDADVRCLAGIAAILGAASESKGADPETVSGLTSIFMYYLGKVDARLPGFNYSEAMSGLMNSPGYDAELAADLKRCGAEAEGRGKMLRDLSEELKGAVPLSRSRTG